MRNLLAGPGRGYARAMTDLPEPVTLEWIARLLVDVEEKIGGIRSERRLLIEMLTRIEANMAAIHEELRAFVAEERQHMRGWRPCASALRLSGTSRSPSSASNARRAGDPGAIGSTA